MSNYTFDYIPCATQTTGETRKGPKPGEINVFGCVKHSGLNVICMHGGTEWLCKTCADLVWLEEQRETGIDRYFRELEENQ